MPININRSSQPGVRTVTMTLLPGGHVLMREPPEGLANPPAPNGAPNWQSDWGTWSVAGDRELRIALPEGSSTGCWDGRTLRLKRGSRTSIYRLFPSLSGTLAGTYSGGEGLPTVTFETSGRFTDRGFQSYLGDVQAVDGAIRFSTAPAERQRRAPGSGRYLLRNSTLELRYDDGRIVSYTLLVNPDAAARTPYERIRIAGRNLDLVTQ